MKKYNLPRLLAASLAAFPLLCGMTAIPLSTRAAEAEKETKPPKKAQTSNLENIVITAFWPPNPNQLNLEEQIQLMADAGITEIFGAGNGCDTPEIQAQLLAEAEKHGMTMIVSDGSFGDTVLNLTAEEIAANVAKYADNPIVTGFHLKDEPIDALDYLDAYKAIRAAAPHLDGHINFFPLTAAHIVTGEKFGQLLNEWASATNSVSENPTWLMYDYYPFAEKDESGVIDYKTYFLHMEILRRVGLQNGNPTASYMQGCGTPQPTAAEIRYNVYSSLAYGIKKISYFLWTYLEGHGSLVSHTGVPSELYYNAAKVNKEVLSLGPILAKCDAVEVYMTQNQYENTELLPAEYILSILEGKNADMILSRFVHKETGRNYLMLVNNDMTAEQSISFTIDEDIVGLEIVSKTDASLSPLASENGIYTVTLAAGDGILLALPED